MMIIFAFLRKTLLEPPFLRLRKYHLLQENTTICKILSEK